MKNLRMGGPLPSTQKQPSYEEKIQKIAS
jgi:hypothetical protein